MKSCSFQDSAHMASARNKIYQRLRRCTHTFSLVSWVHGSKKHVLFRDVWVLMAEFGLVKKYVRSIAAGYWDGPLLSPKGVQSLKREENFEDIPIRPPKEKGRRMFKAFSGRWCFLFFFHAFIRPLGSHYSNICFWDGFHRIRELRFSWDGFHQMVICASFIPFETTSPLMNFKAKVLAGRLICKLLPRLMRHQRIREAAGFHGGKRFRGEGFWLIFLMVFGGNGKEIHYWKQMFYTRDLHIERNECRLWTGLNFRTYLHCIITVYALQEAIWYVFFPALPLLLRHLIMTGECERPSFRLLPGWWRTEFCRGIEKLRRWFF